jgi:uncharacterized membrane protein YccC
MTEKAYSTPKDGATLAGRPFGRRGAPLLWVIAGMVLLSIAAGVAIAFVLGWRDLAFFCVAPAVLAALATAKYKDPRRFVRAAMLGIAAAMLGGLGVVASISPFLAGTLAAIVFGVATAMRVVPAWAIESDLIVLAYFLAAVGAIYTGVGGGLALHVVVLGVGGAFSGMLVAGLLAAWIRRSQPRPMEQELAAIAAPSATLTAGLRAMHDLRNPLVRFAVVRGLALGGFIGWTMAAGADRPTLWALFTLFSVLRPVADDTLNRILLRIAATFAGVVVIGLAGRFLPAELVALLGIAGLGVGILFVARTRFLLALGGTMLAVTLAAAPDGQYLAWGLSRLVGTVVGGGIAVAVVFVLLPAMERALGGPLAQERPR